MGSSICTGKDCASSARLLSGSPARRISACCRPRRMPKGTDLSPRSNCPTTINSLAPSRMSGPILGVRNERARPRKNKASSKLVLPEALDPEIRLRVGERSSSALLMHRKSWMERDFSKSVAYSRIGMTTYLQRSFPGSRIRQLLFPSVRVICAWSVEMAPSASRR